MKGTNMNDVSTVIELNEYVTLFKDKSNWYMVMLDYCDSCCHVEPKVLDIKKLENKEDLFRVIYKYGGTKVKLFLEEYKLKFTKDIMRKVFMEETNLDYDSIEIRIKNLSWWKD